MSTCTVSGSIINGSEEPVEGVLIQFILAAIPAVSSSLGMGVYQSPLECITTSTGYFEIELIRDTDFVVIISALGIKEKIHIPDEATKNLFELTGFVVVDPIQTSTGNEDNW
jgi:hypothetical protein